MRSWRSIGTRLLRPRTAHAPARVRPPVAPDLAEARSRAHAGDLDGAISSAAAGLGRTPGDPGLTDLLARVSGERRVLTPGWLPVAATLAEPSHPRPGRVMLLVSTSVPFRTGGNAQRTRGVALSQLHAGLDPHVVTRPGVPPDPQAPPIQVIEGITHHRLLPGPAAVLPADQAQEAFLRAASDLASDLRPAVIHTAETASMTETTAQVGLALARARQIPMVFEVRGFREESWLVRAGDSAASSQRYRLARDCDTRLMCDADAVVTLSQVMADTIVQRGVPEGHVTVVPNAVDGARFTPGPADPALADEVGVHTDDIVIGYVGGLQPYEGLLTLVEAIGILAARGRPVRALVVGAGPMALPLQTLVRERGLERHVIMTGAVAHEQVVAYYRLMHIVANPRTDDRISRLVSPTKPLEAMAMARALVVSRTPPMEELVANGRTGLVADPDSVDDLVDVLDTLVLDEALRAHLGQAARDWVCGQRSWSANGAAYLDLFRRLGAD